MLRSMVLRDREGGGGGGGRGGGGGSEEEERRIHLYRYTREYLVCGGREGGGWRGHGFEDDV